MSRHKILYIEDDKLDQMAFERHIKKEDLNYDYRISSSIEEALQYIEKENFDLIITDFNLGDGNAFKILDKKLNCPVLMLTGVGDEVVAKEAYEKGVYSFLMKSEDGNHIRFLEVEVENAINHDRVSRELVVAKERAEASTKAKSEFLANMSHELRTPLNAILGFSEMMKLGMVGEMTHDQVDYLTDIYDSGNLLLSLINDILDLSKVEAGKMKLEYANIYVHDLLQRSAVFFKEKGLNKKISLSTNIEEGIETFYGDELRIKQVLVNLLSNAFKFTSQGGFVTVDVIKQESEGGESFIQFTIKDTGSGIREEDLHKLFEPFQQLHNRISHETEGTGLGLALCKEIQKQPGKKSSQKGYTQC